MVHKVVLHLINEIYVGTLESNLSGSITDENIYKIHTDRNDNYTGAERVYLSQMSTTLQSEIFANLDTCSDVEGWLQIVGGIMLAQAAALINGNGGKLTANLRTTEVLDCQRAVNHICKDLPKDLRPIPMQMDYSRPIRPIAPTAKDPRASNAVPVDSHTFIVSTYEQIEA